MKPSLLLGAQTHQELLQLLKARGALVISGAANDTAKALLTARFHELAPEKCMFITENVQRRDALARWLSFFEVSAHRASLRQDCMPESVLPLLQFLESPERRVLLLSAEEWRVPLPSLARLAERKLTLTPGAALSPSKLFEQLLERGYHHNADRFLQPGEYRKVGDVLEVFPFQAEDPYGLLFSFERLERIECLKGADRTQRIPREAPLELFPLFSAEPSPLRDQLAQARRDLWASPCGLLILDEQEEEKTARFPFPTLSFTAFPQAEENHAHLRYLSVLKFYTLADFLNDVRDKLEQRWRLLIVTKRSEELQNILQEEHIPFLLEEECKPEQLTLVPAAMEEILPHSLQNPDLQCALLTDREIFSLRREGKQRSIQKLALDFITSLQPGDYVVHMDHGIGRFEGTTQKTVDEITREYLELRYAGSDRLFTPIDQADKLSKFVHEEGEDPVLHRLGSIEWKRVTASIREEAKNVAKELLALYAHRARAKGFSFPADTEEQRRFERIFPYPETPGQLRALQDIKRDMEGPHPMDRLICGDVGFGKTEVAFRAAFKAVQAGKQVAFIAPITILADQHYHTLLKRAEGFPLRIEMLSRFRLPREQREILPKLRKGEIDVIIGTHRLLQDDVKFFNLGLLIIDEEQRFGVKQKEKLKALRASVDILTLTATPIPRTLNLSLHKLRDITTITTPPPGRLPIITEVRRHSDALVRQAIVAELKRGGQVYMLHNRVETIDGFAEKLQRLVPEATFIVSHGQLRAEDLERRVLQFKEGTCDVLVSSTIIENGIDLPRANTLIVNEAERFGLAQLYQLRGRVGRGNVQAYAYFLYHTQKLQDDAKKRLRAIVEASELGSGFQVSMRDLEIRGAGEILGVGQSGHMKTVGVSHFLRLLKQAVEELRGGVKAPLEEETVEINLPIEAFIPPFYIPDEEEKIGVYQKLAGSEEEAILEEFGEDLLAEYGPLPREVQNLFNILRLKMACRRAGVSRIKMESAGGKREVVVSLAPRVTAEHIIPLLAKNPQWRVSGSTIRIPESGLSREGCSGKEALWLETLRKDIEMVRSGSSETKREANKGN